MSNLLTIWLDTQIYLLSKNQNSISINLILVNIFTLLAYECFPMVLCCNNMIGNKKLSGYEINFNDSVFYYQLMLFKFKLGNPNNYFDTSSIYYHTSLKFMPHQNFLW